MLTFITSPVLSTGNKELKQSINYLFESEELYLSNLKVYTENV